MRESTFTLVYWGFIPSFPTKGQLVVFQLFLDSVIVVVAVVEVVVVVVVVGVAFAADYFYFGYIYIYISDMFPSFNLLGIVAESSNLESCSAIYSPKNTLPETNVAPEPIHFQVLC